MDWHADDEPFFDGARSDIRIISLSLGQERKFDLREKVRHDPWIQISLQDGDLCTMEGMTQK